MYGGWCACACNTCRTIGVYGHGCVCGVAAGEVSVLVESAGERDRRRREEEEEEW